MGKPKHRYRQQKAAIVLPRLGPNNPATLAYLRKIDPFVFEEPLLTCLADKGFRVQRNERYTGDGGIVGRFVDRLGRVFLLQAKSYKGAISSSHVGTFLTLLSKQKGCKAAFLFILVAHRLILSSLCVSTGSILFRG